MFPALLTPFDESLSIDYEFLELHVEWLRERGVHGLALAGTTGEFTHLSVIEKKDLFQFVYDIVPKDFQLIAGTGSSSVRDAVELTSIAYDIGIKAALIAPPYYVKNAPIRALKKYYEMIFEQVPEMPIIAYNFPEMTGNELSIPLLDHISQYKNYLGVKDSSGSLESFKDIAKAFPERVNLVGFENHLSEALKVGGAGTISALANLFPGLCVDVYQAFTTNNAPDLQSFQQVINDISEILYTYPVVGMLKLLIGNHLKHKIFCRPTEFLPYPEELEVAKTELRGVGAWPLW
ncbi:MAG: dihydrodipicolinate synthase family protein [Candidatus Kariarchaeaceae archaeon]